jgi:hypothetical protein
MLLGVELIAAMVEWWKNKYLAKGVAIIKS